MQRLALVKNTDGKTAEVNLLISTACINCPTNCIEHNKSFTVRNKKNFPITVGDYVKIEMPKAMEISAGIFSLFFPIISATGAFLFLKRKTELCSIALTETKTFALTLATLVLAEAIVFLFSRMKFQLSKSKYIITQIL